MNKTNRAMNRFFLAATGLVLLCAGVLAAAAGMVPAIRDRWDAVGAGLPDKWQALLRTAPAPEPLGSWWALGVLLLLLLGAAGVSPDYRTPEVVRAVATAVRNHLGPGHVAVQVTVVRIAPASSVPAQARGD